MKRVIFVHGWEAGPDTNWFPWLRGELEQRGFEVVAPQLPNPEEPKKEEWVPALAAAVEGLVNEQTYFIAHSLGNQATLRYLETLPSETKVGGALFVAGFLLPLTNLEGPEEEAAAAAWTNAPLDLAKVRTHLPKSIALFSDNDQWVPLDNADRFRDTFGSEIVVEHARGHFTEDKEPAVLREFLKLAA